MSATQLLLLLVAWVAVLLPAVVTGLKGHVGLFVAGFLLVGVVWVIAALRLARPNSLWARRFYGPEKLGRSRARYRDVDPAASNPAVTVMAVSFGLLGTAFLFGVASTLLA